MLEAMGKNRQYTTPSWMAPEELTKIGEEDPLLELSENPPTPENNIFEKWATFATKVLEHESQLVRHHVKHPTIVGDARETLVSGVLSRVLPPIYEVGTGWIVDSRGKESKQIDVIIARKDFPALRFPDGSAQYLIESVLAAIEVKSTLDKGTLHQALDNCRSVGDLLFMFDVRTLKDAISAIEKRDGTVLEFYEGELWEVDTVDGSLRKANSWVRNQLRLLGRPETYIFGFEGYSEDIDSFCSAIMDWCDAQKTTALAWLPTVIAAKGCVALRNQVGTVDRERGVWPLMMARRDPNPLGRLVTLLLQHIQRSVSITPAENGVCPSIAPYLNAMFVDNLVGISWVRL